MQIYRDPSFPRRRIWTHPFSQVISYVKSEVFAFVYPAINERLIVRSGPDDIRTLSPYRAIGYSHPRFASGIYRVGFTIFTSAVICKTGVSLLCLHDCSVTLINLAFFVISDFY